MKSAVPHCYMVVNKSASIWKGDIMNQMNGPYIERYISVNVCRNWKYKKQHHQQRQQQQPKCVVAIPLLELLLWYVASICAWRIDTAGTTMHGKVRDRVRVDRRDVRPGSGAPPLSFTLLKWKQRRRRLYLSFFYSGSKPIRLCESSHRSVSVT